MTRLLPSVLLALLCVASAANADELRLKNGDRITGVVVSLASGTLTFKATGGDLKIAWPDVVSLAIEQPILVRVGAAPPVSATFAPADATGRITLVPGGPVALADIVALSRQQPAWVFTGGAGAGIVQSAGNTQVNNARLSGNVVATGAAFPRPIDR